jgi:protein-S-isoprenylcysteine O-methyltransferase Ste14
MRRHGLGSEHPLCDTMQLIFLILFFTVLAIDTSSFFMLKYSTVILNAVSFPALLLGMASFLGVGLYLVSKAHKAVFGESRDQPKLIDSDVYGLVRHPMYLGTLLFCLSFLFISVSLLSTAILISLFIFFDRMATYEEKSLIDILGEEYIAYQKRVSKWLPRPR